MRKILIYDIAAEKTGAATVLRQYYEKYSSDRNVECVVVTSVMEFPQNKHTEIVKLPWTKKSWFHRLFCDNFYIRSLIKEYQVDEVLNLQNIAVKGLRIPQTLYLHNAIPISNIDFDFKTERSLWVFKHMISRVIRNNLRYADRIIVQAEWIKREVVAKCGVDESAVIVERVTPALHGSKRRIKTEIPVFFYPANPCSYKNHECILKACEGLKNEGIHNYEVVFTLNPDEGTRERQLKKRVADTQLPIRFAGLLNEEQMVEMYRKTILLFPSYLETVGLPLIEAQLFHANIFAADLPYAREAIGGYNRVEWFDCRNPGSLKEIMEGMIIAYNNEPD